MNIIDFEENLPEFVGDIKDCWLAAMTSVAVCMEKDYRILLFHNSFQYSETDDNDEISFEKIIHKHMDMHLKGDIVTPLIANEDIFLHKLMNLNVSYYSMDNISKDRREYLKSLVREHVAVIWLDIFFCPWNPMYQKKHILHCVTLVETKENIIYAYDSLKNKQAVFTVDLDLLFDIGIFLFIYKDEMQNQLWDIESAYQYYVEEFLKTNGLHKAILFNLKRFYADLIKMKNSYTDYKELEDENVVRLMMRLFENQYEKSTLQAMIFKDISCVIPESIDVLEKIGTNWKLASFSFARACFLPVSQKKDCFSKVCLLVGDILADTELFFHLITGYKTCTDI